MRRWNPLGFKIVDYRTEAEVLVPEGGPVAAGHPSGQVP
jgi:hypothetical protein